MPERGPGQSVSDIPAGSNNEFMPSPSLIARSLEVAVLQSHSLYSCVISFRSADKRRRWMDNSFVRKSLLAGTSWAD